jgi:hypothetical protein
MYTSLLVIVCTRRCATATRAVCVTWAGVCVQGPGRVLVAKQYYAIVVWFGLAWAGAEAFGIITTCLASPRYFDDLE